MPPSSDGWRAGCGLNMLGGAWRGKWIFENSEILALFDVLHATCDRNTFLRLKKHSSTVGEAVAAVVSRRRRKTRRIAT